MLSPAGNIAAVNVSSSQPVLISLIPVVLLIALGFVAGRLQWIRDSAVRDLSNLVFLVLIPALLFRTMSSVRVEQLDTLPLLVYFSAALGLFFVLLAFQGFHRRAVALALAGVFSNTVMIGIPLVELAYGKAGLVTLLTLISVHALVLLTVITIVFELVVAREARASGAGASSLWGSVGAAVKSTVIHPIPLPILCGLLFAQTGWGLPVVVDKPLQLLANAFGPIALLLVGVTMSRTRVAGLWRDTLWVTLLKNLALPACVAASGWLWGLQGLPWTVMVVAAALPVGANVFLFAQRYQVAEDVVTASVGVSTAVAMVTLSAVVWLVS